MGSLNSKSQHISLVCHFYRAYVWACSKVTKLLMDKIAWSYQLEGNLFLNITYFECVVMWSYFACTFLACLVVVIWYLLEVTIHFDITIQVWIQGTWGLAFHNPNHQVKSFINAPLQNHESTQVIACRKIKFWLVLSLSEIFYPPI